MAQTPFIHRGTVPRHFPAPYHRTDAQENPALLRQLLTLLEIDCTELQPAEPAAPVHERLAELDRGQRDAFSPVPGQWKRADGCYYHPMPLRCGPLPPPAAQHGFMPFPLGPTVWDGKVGGHHYHPANLPTYRPPC